MTKKEMKSRKTIIKGFNEAMRIRHRFTEATLDEMYEVASNLEEEARDNHFEDVPEALYIEKTEEYCDLYDDDHHVRHLNDLIESFENESSDLRYKLSSLCKELIKLKAVRKVVIDHLSLMENVSGEDLDRKSLFASLAKVQEEVKAEKGKVRKRNLACGG